MSNFFDDSDDEQQPGGSPSARSASAVAGGADDSFSSHRAASPRPYHQARPRASEAGGRVSSTTGGGAGGGGRQSSVTGGASGYYGNSTRGGSPNLDDILGGDDDDEFGGGVGADEAGESNMDRLIRAWNNEIGAPEVLRFPKRLVERVTKDLYRRKQLVAHAVAQKNAEESLYLQANLVAMENLRATHVLKSLMRERLFKIEKFVEYYVSEDDARARLYHSEVNHAVEYNEIRTAYMDEAFASAMREMINHKLPMRSPNFSQAVFVRVRKACGPIVLPDGELMELEKGSQHMFRYSSVRDLLDRDEVELL